MISLLIISSSCPGSCRNVYRLSKFPQLKLQSRSSKDRLKVQGISSLKSDVYVSSIFSSRVMNIVTENGGVLRRAEGLSLSKTQLFRNLRSEASSALEVDRLARRGLRIQSWGILCRCSFRCISRCDARRRGFLIGKC